MVMLLLAYAFGLLVQAESTGRVLGAEDVSVLVD
jgi:hypothetical protein